MTILQEAIAVESIYYDYTAYTDAASVFRSKHGRDARKVVLDAAKELAELRSKEGDGIVECELSGTTVTATIVHNGGITQEGEENDDLHSI